MKCSRHFIRAGNRIPRVDLIEIDMIGLETVQRIFAGPQNVFVSRIGMLAFGGDITGHNGELVPQSVAFHQDTQLLFSVAVAIRIGGIEEVDAMINSGVHRLLPWLQSDFAPKGGTQLPAAKTDAGNVKIGVTKLGVFHGDINCNLPVKLSEIRFRRVEQMT